MARREVRRIETAARDERWGIDLVTRYDARGQPANFVFLRVAGHDVPPSFSALGERGRPAEVVADEAWSGVHEFLTRGGTVDDHAADQLLLPTLLHEDSATYSTAMVTNHLITNARTIGRFCDREIRIEGAEGEPGTVTIAAGKSLTRPPDRGL